jgi:hypothetical protein
MWPQCHIPQDSSFYSQPKREPNIIQEHHDLHDTCDPAEVTVGEMMQTKYEEMSYWKFPFILKECQQWMQGRDYMSRPNSDAFIFHHSCDTPLPPTPTFGHLPLPASKQSALKQIIEISLNYVRFEVFTAVTMKNGVFWDVMPCGPCKNRCFGGT